MLGAGATCGIGDALGLSHTPAAVPGEDVAAAPRRVAAPAPPLASIVVPDEPRTAKAASTVADALASRGLPRPAVTPAAPGPTPPVTTTSAARPAAGARTAAGPTPGPRTAGSAATAAPAGTTAPDLSAVTTLRAGVLATLSTAPESYRLSVRGTELAVEGGDVAGTAAGLYRLADGSAPAPRRCPPPTPAGWSRPGSACG
ncbi:hypothetical protein ACVCAH_35045 [Micromonospora sp. LZ34]